MKVRASKLVALSTTLLCIVITPGRTADLDEIDAFDYIAQQYGTDRRILIGEDESDEMHGDESEQDKDEENPTWMQYYDNGADEQGGTDTDEGGSEEYTMDSDLGDTSKNKDSVSVLSDEDEQIKMLVQPLAEEISRIITKLTQGNEPINAIENAKYDLKKIEHLRDLKQLFINFHRLSNQMRHDHYRYMQQLHDKWEEQVKIQMRAAAEVDNVEEIQSKEREYLEFRKRDEQKTFEQMIKVWNDFVDRVSEWVSSDTMYSEVIQSVQGEVA